MVDLSKIMDAITEHKDRVLEQLLSVSAEMSTHIKRSEWNRIDRLAKERTTLIDQLSKMEPELKAASQETRQRWHLKLMAANQLHDEVQDLIRKYQGHIQVELKSLSDQKSALISDALIDAKGQNVSTRG